MSSMILSNSTLEVLEVFTSDYNTKIYGRNVARRLEMNQKTVSNILNQLEKQHLLKFKHEGKNKYYFLNKLNSKVKEIIKLTEIHKKVKFLNKYRKLNELINKLEQRTEGILIIFGSYANFSANEKSDLDVFVSGKIEELNDLESLYNIKINVVKAKKIDSKEILVREVINNHIIINGVEKFIELIW